MKNIIPLLTRKSASRGFTLVEMILVLSIIAVLMGSTIYMLKGNVEAAKVKRVESDLVTISTQLSTYEMLNVQLPTSEQGLDALVTLPTQEPVPRRWRQLLSEVPVDPWGRNYQYANPGTHNPSSYDLSSLGPDGVVSADDIGNWK